MDQQDPSAEPLLVFSASDLVAASECEYRLLRTLDEKVGRAAHPALDVDDMLERTATLGDVHEQQVLEGLVELVGRDGVREIPVPRSMRREHLEAAHAATLDALRDGVDVVYQGSFFDGRFHGRADFLIRTDSRAAQVSPYAGGPTASGTAGVPGTGGAEYAVHDAKLARRAKVPALLQLAAYADQLLAAGVRTSPTLHLILGTRAVTDHRLADVLPVFRERRTELLRLLDTHRAGGEPVRWDAPGLRQCGTCAYCAQQVTEHDDVLRVAGLRSTQRVRLRAAGITTMTQLASATTPPPGLAARTFETLRVQARLQACLVDVPGDGGGVPDVGPGPSGSVTWSTPGAEDVEGTGVAARPEQHTLSYVVVDPAPLRDLPRPDPGDVFFDFEGDPLWSVTDPATRDITWNIDYLFGLVERPGSPDEKPPFRAFWAHDLEQEKQALIDFVDYLAKRRAQYPGLHVYHYASYEKTHLLSIAARHGVYEQEVDDLLRQGVLVDLYATVRHSLKVSAPSYSIKKLEPLYMGDQLRGGDVTDAAASVVAYATYCAARDAGRTEEAEHLLRGIADYNEYDCLSTLRLHEFLLGLAGRSAPATSDVTGSPAPPAGTGWEDDLPPALELSDAEVARRAKRAEAEQVELDVRALAGGVDGRSGEGRTDDEEAVALLGAGVGYYWREAKPFWQEYFARLKDPVDQWQTPRAYFLVERAEVIEDWARATPRSNPSRRLRLYGELPDGSELKAGYDGATALFEGPAPDGIEPAHGAVRWSTGSVRVHGVERGRLGTGREVDVLDVRMPVPKGVAPHDALPMALTVGQVLPTPQQEASVRALAATVQALNPAGSRSPLVLPDHPALDLLRRRPPRTVSGAPLPTLGDGPERYIDAVTDAVRDLDGSYLGVQGPPGTGKTHLASKVVGRLVAEGWRVGVVAQSHDVVENVLAGVIAKGGVPADRVGKKASGPKGRDVSAVGREAGAGLPDDVAAAALPDGSRLVPWRLVDSAQTAAFVAEGPCVVGGTAWDLAHAERFGDGELDLLVIDEAGQFSLANTIAVSRAAQRLLLLGDPQQLPQVSQGQHPEPVDQSALGWLTRAGGGHDVLPPEFGYFLARSWRMHPALCDAVSDLAYEGLLHAEAAAGERLLVGVEPGVHVVEVEHAGNAVSSVEEAQEIVRQVKALLGTAWYPHGPAAGGSRPLGPEDFVVVAPYNAQVWTVRHALQAAGLGDVRVGTVDKFQGKEAPVAIVSMTASAREDVPRGMEFLLSRNRVNVAVSRGQWCAVVVRSPRLTDYLPNHPAELAELGAFIGLCGAGTRSPLR
ncbi:TM0106 family RecB-like putative nuclease [Oerskovia sp. Sa1BUA8]|uniref:TM0106 family RecB-like putative nuclease n=1 Tax=Oerskovia douganii TaxID=2762210 RepID=A0A9D5U9Z0_9CELL|nr:bifunctional RecB family nuclease/DEAD/DEAH box helicase [Oerskovia douganii]MBE7700529.1 TM0106 family RecB-like putative nuclease [Oerskovia douganii]